MEFNRHKRAFIKNQNVNPETGKNIKINGVTHQKLVKKYLDKKSPKQIKSPKILKYDIMNNGGTSFVVFIKDKVYIHKNNFDFKLDKNIMEPKPRLTYRPEKIWIGKSPKNKMTEFSGAYGPKYDGNSILLKLKNEYIYIGSMIYSFVPLAPIKSYVSPVGNSGVPYPYAIDTKNNIYLMIEDVIMLNRTSFTDPYDDYYDIAMTRGVFTYKGIKIKDWFSGEHYSMLSYFPKAGEKYDRLTKNGKLQMYIVDVNNKKYILDKSKFIDWMKEFETKNNFKPLDYKIIIERD